MELVSIQENGVLRAEVRLIKPMAIRSYAEATDVPSQIAELAKNGTDIFKETFARVISFSDFYKMDAFVKIHQAPMTFMK